jgi:SAM-dependent methyltransferase
MAPPDAPHPLVLTGERTLPGIADERYWFARHVVAYDHAAGLVREGHAGGAVVALDAGCGEGYGLALLRGAGAARVIGVDLDGPTVAHARRTYATPDPAIEVHDAELSSLPIPTGSVDLTVSFQVIEHLHDITGYLASLRRVTRPGGTVAFATPNRLTFTPGSDTPVNPFHTREFTAAELRAELARAGYEVVEVLGVHHGRRLSAFERARGVELQHLLGATPPDGWDDELRSLVHTAGPGDFEVHDRDVDASLDLLAITRRPAEARTTP